MPALGNRPGGINPAKIKAAAKKPAPPARKLPGVAPKPERLPVGLFSKAHTEPTVRGGPKGLRSPAHTGAGQGVGYRRTFGNKYLQVSEGGLETPIPRRQVPTDVLLEMGKEKTRGQYEKGQLLKPPSQRNPETRHLQVGIATPTTLPFLGTAAKGLAVATGAGKIAAAVSPSVSDKTLPGKLYKEAVSLVAGALPATIETVKNPDLLVKQAEKYIHHPFTTAKEEPLATLLIAKGLTSAVGRGSGAVARRTPGVHFADTNTRPVLKVYGRSTGASEDQLMAGIHDINVKPDWSPDLIRKGGQVAAQTYRERVLGHNPHMATPEQANRYLYGGSLIGQHTFKKVRGFFKPGLVDKQAAQGESLRRLYSHAAAHYLGEIKPKIGAEAVPLAVEGVLKRPDTVVADLKREKVRLEESAKELTGGELKLNKANQRQINNLLNDKKFIATKGVHAFEAARQYAAWARPLEQRLVELGHLEPDQLHARNIPYALAHYPGAKFNQAPGAHEYVGHLKIAKENVDKANRAVKKAKEAAHPVQREVAAAHKAVQRARGGREGRMIPSQMQQITGWHGAVTKAEARLTKAKGARDAAIREAKERQTDAINERNRISSHLADLKESGAIRPTGELWPRLEKANGQPLHHSEIEAHMAKELGDRNVAFLTHKAERSYGQLMQSHPGARPGTEVRRRTGEAFGKGTYKRDYAALAQQAYGHANNIAGHENLNQMLRRFGIGRFKTHEDAQAALDNFMNTEEGKAIERSLGAPKVQRIGPERVVRAGHVETRSVTPVLEDYGHTIHKAINETADHPQFTLLPDVVAKRLQQHDALNQSSEGLRALQWYTNKWRGAALYASPRWMAGNVQEHAIRLAMANTNPFAVLSTKVSFAGKLGKSLLDDWHHKASDMSLSEEARYVARQHIGAWEAGTHYGSQAMNVLRRTAKDDVMEPGEVRDWADALNETTPVAKLSSAWQKYKNWVGHGQAAVERNAKATAIGKAALRDVEKFGKEWQGLMTRQDAMVKKVADGTLDPNEAAAFGNDVMDMMGNWSELTPVVRRAVQTWSPFGLWWLTSMKFVFRTMPRDHPFKVAALAAMVSATGQEEKLENMPEYLRGGVAVTLPVVGKVTLTPEYYSPAGVAIEPLKTATSMIAPQVLDQGKLALGINPLTDEQIKEGAEKPSEDQLAAQIAGVTATGMIPFARQFGQLFEAGGKHKYTSYNPFATIPGTKRGVGKTALKIASPARLTYGSRTEETGRHRGRERETRERGGRERGGRER